MQNIIVRELQLSITKQKIKKDIPKQKRFKGELVSVFKEI
jgi:hypothetical protein